jgi:hypothetical protein
MACRHRSWVPPLRSGDITRRRHLAQTYHARIKPVLTLPALAVAVC